MCCSQTHQAPRALSLKGTPQPKGMEDPVHHQVVIITAAQWEEHGFWMKEIQGLPSVVGPEQVL